MPEMTLEMAKEILTVAAKESAWDPPDGKSLETTPNEQIFADAAQLVDLSRTTYEKGVRNDLILDILFSAQIEPVDGKFEDVYARKNAAPPTGSSAPATPEATPEPAQPFAEAASGEIDINSIYPGYDNQKIKDIVPAIKESAASGDLTPEEFAQIQAYEEANEGRKGILSLEPEFKPKEQPREVGETGRPPDSQPSAAPGDYADINSLKGSYEDGTVGRNIVDGEHLPIPLTPTGPEPILPVDITLSSDADVSRLIMQFHSLEARTLWLVSQEEGRAEAAGHIQGDAHRGSYAHHFERIKSGLEKQTPTAVGEARAEANREADQDSTVIKWRNRKVQHLIEARSLKALAEGYEKAAARLSRDQSRRENLRQTPSS